MAPLKIAIIGAGPSGTTLARLLQHSGNPNITVTIFESEASLNFRSQGGTLDLHEKTGQAALKAAGLLDQFNQHARYDGEAMKFCDKKLLCYVRMGGSAKPKVGTTSKPSTGRPEIDRPVLRQMLYESLAEGTVQWGKKLLRVTTTSAEHGSSGHGRGILHFADGTVEEGFDVIVGADGAWSRVRTCLSDVKPEYSGVGGHSYIIPDAEKRHLELYELVNRGSVFAWSDGKSIMGQQMGDGSIDVKTWQTLPADWQQTAKYDLHDGAAVKAEMVKDFTGWDPRLMDLFLKADDHVIPRDLYMLPIGFKWDHCPGLTLIGDAAHLMTPFAGEGVNLAMKDSLQLSEHLLKAASAADPRAALDKQLIAFEVDMFKRAAQFQQLTYDLMNQMLFVPGAPRTTIESYILRAMGDEVGWLGTMLLTPVVYAWFGVFKMIW